MYDSTTDLKSLEDPSISTEQNLQGETVREAKLVAAEAMAPRERVKKSRSAVRTGEDSPMSPEDNQRAKMIKSLTPEDVSAEVRSDHSVSKHPRLKTLGATSNSERTSKQDAAEGRQGRRERLARGRSDRDLVPHDVTSRTDARDQLASLSSTKSSVRSSLSEDSTKFARRQGSSSKNATRQRSHARARVHALVQVSPGQTDASPAPAERAGHAELESRQVHARKEAKENERRRESSSKTSRRDRKHPGAHNHEVRADLVLSLSQQRSADV
eukprot:753410-Hanusia_phi.AAC.1